MTLNPWQWLKKGVSFFARKEEDTTAVHDDPRFLYQIDREVGEKYRTLAWQVDHLRSRQAFQVLTVTSSVPSEGKSTVVVNLAAVLAERSAQRVLVIDCDLRRPRLHDLVGGGTPGLNELLTGDCTLQEALYFDDALGLYYIPVSEPVDEPMKLLATTTGLSRVIAEARQLFDYILLDSPPVLPVSDALFLTEIGDAVLFVVRAGETSGRMLSRALGSMQKEKLLGIVFNGTQRGRGYGYDPYARPYERSYGGAGRSTSGRSQGTS